MTEYHLPYGKTQLRLEIPAERVVEIVEPQPTPEASDPLGTVATALRNPVGGVALAAFQGASSVGIAINDKTRPVPHHYLLPPLLAELHRLGIPPQAITFYIATGTHPPMPPEEYGWILPPELVSTYRVVCHDAKDQDSLAYLGMTPAGTPVYANREYCAANLKIVVGNIEPHQFAGFSGGVKSAAIGLAGLETINANHAHMMEAGAELGAYEGNPARQDIEDIGERIGVHFALNAILNQRHQVVHAIAGEPKSVMRHGIPLSRPVCQVGVKAPFDLVIVSAGGHPKDINLYQAQKGLGHAVRVTRPGGAVLLAAACPEGTGSRAYEDWVVGMSSNAQVFERFRREGFRIGPHKAFQLARDSARVNLKFYSDMPAGFVRQLLLEPIADFQAALNAALDALPPDGRIGLLPRAAETIPYLNP